MLFAVFEWPDILTAVGEGENPIAFTPSVDMLARVALSIQILVLSLTVDVAI